MLNVPPIVPNLSIESKYEETEPATTSSASINACAFSFIHLFIFACSTPSKASLFLSNAVVCLSIASVAVSTCPDARSLESPYLLTIPAESSIFSFILS